MYLLGLIGLILGTMWAITAFFGIVCTLADTDFETKNPLVWYRECIKTIMARKYDCWDEMPWVLMRLSLPFWIVLPFAILFGLGCLLCFIFTVQGAAFCLGLIAGLIILKVLFKLSKMYLNFVMNSETYEGKIKAKMIGKLKKELNKEED